MTNLTEKWKNKELKWHKSYYCKNKKGDITVATLMGDSDLYSKELGGTLNFGYWEVLAPCDYEELQALKAENAVFKDLIKECQNKISEVLEDYAELDRACAIESSCAWYKQDFMEENKEIYKFLTKINEVLK